MATVGKIDRSSRARDFAIIELEEVVCSSARPAEIGTDLLRVGQEVEMSVFQFFETSKANKTERSGYKTNGYPRWMRDTVFVSSNGRIGHRNNRFNSKNFVVSHSADMIKGASGGGLFVTLGGKRYLAGINIRETPPLRGNGQVWNNGIEISEGFYLNKCIQHVLETNMLSGLEELE